MSLLPPASIEQRAVLDHLHKGNVVVDSVAGSGKTTCNLHLANFFEHVRPEWNVSCLLLTYNAKLKLETREKVAKLGFSRRMEVHSFHAFCVKYYSRSCFSDKAIVNMLRATRSNKRYPVRRTSAFSLMENQPAALFADCLKPIPAYDVVIVDEAQDLTPTLYELVCKIVADVSLSRQLRCTLPVEPRLLILGDRHQSIYGFMDADERYICYAKEIFSMWSSVRLRNVPTPIRNMQLTSDHPLNVTGHAEERATLWSSLRLTESFRITRSMSNFINKCMLRTDSPDEGHHIRSNKESLYQPRYRICDSFTDDTYAEIDYYLNQCGYNADDIFVLAPSIKSSMCPARRLENIVKERFGNQIQIYAPNDDDERLDERILSGKLVFSTFHQAKGLERKCVIVFGFDSSYYKLYKKNYDVYICPNEFYVACTRASEQLSLIHHYRNEHLPFLNASRLQETCQIISDRIIRKNQPDEETDTEKMIEIPVTRLLDHLPERVLHQCMELVSVYELETPEKGILMPGIESKVQMKHGGSDMASTFESVSDINGTAIPMWYEYRLTGKMTIQEKMVGIESCEGGKDVYVDAVNLAVNVRESRRSSKDASVHDESAQLRKAVPPSVSEVLEMANHWQSYIGGYVFKVYQINNYSWLSQDTLERCVCRMARTLNIGQSSLEAEKSVASICSSEGGVECLHDDMLRSTVSDGARSDRIANIVFELKLEMEGLPNYPNRKLVGSIDCVDMNMDARNLYEFKCTKELDVTHILQVVCYAYLLQKVWDGKASIAADAPSWVAKKVESFIKVEGHERADQVHIEDTFDERGQQCCKAMSDSESSDCELMSIKLPGDVQPVSIDEQQRLLCERAPQAKRQRVGHHDGTTAGQSQLAMNETLQAEGDSFKYYLYNVFTDELKLVKCSNLDQIMAIILEAKFGQRGDCTNEQFLQRCEAIKSMYYE